MAEYYGQQCLGAGCVWMGRGAHKLIIGRPFLLLYNGGGGEKMKHYWAKVIVPSEEIGISLITNLRSK